MIFSHSKWGLELGVAGIILDRGDTAERTKRCGTVTVCTTMITEFRVIIATALCNHHWMSGPILRSLVAKFTKL